METRTRPTTPRASHSPLLVGRPFTTSPVQPIIPADAHQGRSPRTSADQGRNISRSRVQPRLAHTLASTLQLDYPPRRGTPLIQSLRRSLMVGQGSLSRLDRQFFRQLLHRPLPRRPGTDQDRPPAVVLHPFTERCPRVLVPFVSSDRGTGSRCPTQC